MRNSYDVKLSTLEENLRKETGGRRPAGQRGGRPAFLLILSTDVYRALSTTRINSVSSSQQPGELGTTLTLIL